MNKHCIDLLQERLKLIELINNINIKHMLHYNERKLIENEINLRNWLPTNILNKIFTTKYSYVIDKQQIDYIKNVILTY